VDDRAKGLVEGGGAVIAVLALAGVIATAWSAYASKDEELKVHLVEIAMGILRADPAKEDVAPARARAMDAIDKYSGLRPFTADERAALLHKPIGGALPADAGLPEWKKTFKGYGRDGFIIIPPRTSRMGLASCRRGSERIGSKIRRMGRGSGRIDCSRIPRTGLSSCLIRSFLPYLIRKTCGGRSHQRSERWL
jgi:hypothetical protein